MLRLPLMVFAGALLLSTGCRTLDSQQTSRQAAALKQAHDAGVLSDAEYQQKLQALRGATTTPGASSAARGNVAGTKGNAWHMKRVVFKQNTTMEAMPQWGIAGHPGREVDAMAMLIPMDWTFQAGNAPGQLDCNMTSGRILALAMSPEKTTGVLIFPGKVSMWSNDQSLMQSVQMRNQRFQRQANCVLQQPPPLAQAIVGIARGLNKDVQITGPMEPVPGLSDKLPEMLAQANRTLAAQGAHVEATAGRIPTKGTDGGITTEGFLSVLQVVKTERLQNGATVVTTDYPVQVATFTPEGKYAALEPMLNAMLDSVVIDPEFEQHSAEISAGILSIQQQTMQNLQRIQSQMVADNANAARQQAQIRAGAQAYANDKYRSVAANRSAALDHSTQQFALHMGDQAIYRDPATGARVQMSSQYSHAWASGNSNEYILSDSPSFNPNGQVGSGSWTQLQQER